MIRTHAVGFDKNSKIQITGFRRLAQKPTSVLHLARLEETREKEKESHSAWR
ncbi:MAG: hypothetical protein KA327_11530 [Pseudarcicella sp.]|nr:hypothetical protein [Pseudarcicella sp.]